MKKILFAALAALAITSCTQNDEIEAPSQKKEIDFKGIVNKSARAVGVDKTTLENSTTGFNVYAYNVGTTGSPSTTTSFITNGTIKYENTSWSSDKKYYWPTNGDKIIFYAYFSPKSIITSLSAENGDECPKIKDYTVPVQPASQEDLLVAKTAALDNNTTSVDFTFNHALTQVNFSVKPKVEDANLTYTITEITIKGVHNQGTYDYKTSNWTNPSNLPSDITYTYPIENGSKEIVANAASTTTATQLDDTNNLLILMPQTLTAEAKINIKYKVSNTDGIIFDATSTGKEIAIGGDSNTNWTEGYKIRYTLSLTNDAKDISYSVSNVSGWTDDDVSKETPNS